MQNNSFGPPRKRRNSFFGSPGSRGSSGSQQAGSSRPATGRPAGTRYGGAPRRRGQYIDPAKFINKQPIEWTAEIYEPKHRFTDFKFSDALKRNVAAHGYSTPTPIQDQTIEIVLSGKDILGLANTGTGKTAAFLLPIITRFQNQGGRGQALIIVPTRELAAQIDEEFRAFARGLHLFSALCVGGMNINPQISSLRRRPQVIIGTPGRLKDLYGQGELKVGSAQVLVLDEADRMFDMGFIKDIRFLVALLPRERQSMCFSATMPKEVEQLMYEVLKEPVKVSVKKTETAEHVEQDIIEVNSRDQKAVILAELLKKPEFSKVLIFGETKWGVQRLADNLSKSGFRVEAIHGNKSQPQRARALDAFKKNRVQILVATDVAARGLDIPNVSHVINFDQPASHDDYVHRIGRTGRAGKRGKALTFVLR